MTPIEPSLLAHITAGGTDPVPWVTSIPWTVITLPPVTVVPGPMTTLPNLYVQTGI